MPALRRLENRPLQVIPLRPFSKNVAQKFLGQEAVLGRNDVVFINNCSQIVKCGYTNRFNIHNIKNHSAALGYCKVRRQSRAVA